MYCAHNDIICVPASAPAHNDVWTQSLLLRPSLFFFSASSSSCSGHEVERSYTPVVSLSLSSMEHSNIITTSSSSSSSSDHETLQLMIKLYSDGEMSRHLAKLNVGDHIMVSDPQGTFDSSRLEAVTDAVLIAAGSGE